MAEYQPGVCNIGGREQQKRYFLGAAGFTSPCATFCRIQRFHTGKVEVLRRLRILGKAKLR